MDISFSDEFAYMSAHTCASSCSQEILFYSAPTSPSRVKLCALSGFQTTYEDANSNLDEFEFETSRRFNLIELDNETRQKDENSCDQQQEQQGRVQRQREEDSLPTMAFADELFCDGKVLPLIPPLKLPPRLQSGNVNMMSTQRSTVSSPRSPGLVLRLPFSRHSLWNDDFDPFVVALEKVKEEKRGKLCLRRTRSFSPFRGLKYKFDKQVEPLKPTQQSEDEEGKEAHCCGQAQVMCELQKEPLKERSGLRLVGVGNDASFEPKRTSVAKLVVETEKDESKIDGSWTKKRKKEKIMKFLFGNAYKGKPRAQHKLQDQKAAFGKPTFPRKLDMKPGISTESTKWDKDEAKGEVTNMTLVCHEPRLFLCLG